MARLVLKITKTTWNSATHLSSVRPFYLSSAAARGLFLHIRSFRKLHALQRVKPVGRVLECSLICSQSRVRLIRFHQHVPQHLAGGYRQVVHAFAVLTVGGGTEAANCILSLALCERQTCFSPELIDGFLALYVVSFFLALRLGLRGCGGKFFEIGPGCIRLAIPPCADGSRPPGCFLRVELAGGWLEV